MDVHGRISSVNNKLIQNGRAVLVTGGAGYIGSHCCKALSQEGFIPVCFDDLSTGHREFVRWGPLVRGDIRNEAALIDAIKRFNVVATLHFAAVSSVGESVAQPQKYYHTNVLGTLTVLRAMELCGCDKFLFSSSGAVYGDCGDRANLDERAACDPINPYGRSKLMIERILDDYRQAEGLRSFAFRYFNACGADPDGDLGELRTLETHLIPRAMRAVFDRRLKFSIYGDDYATPDGTAIRDYIHVSDLAAAHVRALELLMDGHTGCVLNLGSSVGHSVRTVLAAIERETRCPIPHTVRPRRAGDPAVLVADPNAASNLLKITPTLSDLGTIIRTAWAWHASKADRAALEPTSTTLR